MTQTVQRHGWTVALVALGLAAGMFMAQRLPEQPIGATATDRSNDYILATGFVDEGVEAVYYLDYLTGQLNAGVLQRQTKQFQAIYRANVNADFAKVIAAQNAIRVPGASPLVMPQKPNYLLVTGMNNFTISGGTGLNQPGASVVYIAETNTGMVLVYAVPWDRSAYRAGTPYEGMLIPWTARQFSSAVFRD